MPSLATVLAAPLVEIGASGGVTTYTYVADLPNSDNTTGDMAFVTDTNRLYVWNNGWYSIALINTSPSFTTSPDASYNLSTDGTPINLSLAATDPEGFPLTWSYSVTAGSLTNGGGTTAAVTNNGNGSFTITPTTTEAYAGEFTLTFTASDGVNIATAPAEFSLVFNTAVDNSKYTTIFLKANSSGSNVTFVDSSTAAHSITTYGETTQTGLSPYATHYSNYFDGSGDYIQFPNWVGPGTGDFTVEAWIMLTGAPSDSIITATDWTNPGMQWYVRSNYTILWQIYNQNSTNGGTIAITQGQWYHVAWSRVSGTNYLFIDGDLQDTTAGGNSIGTTNFYVGGRATTQPFPGYISNVRVLVGEGLYTSNFTVPTEPLTEISNTSLITCQGPTTKDITGNYTAQVNGDTKTIAWSPFDREAYASGTHAGSGYFDGSGDYLKISPSADFEFDGDFTIEGWMYFTNVGDGSPQALFSVKSGTSEFDIRWYTSRWQVSQNAGSGTDIGSTPAPVEDTWTHVACVRNGSNIKVYVNGVATGAGLTNSNTLGYSNVDASIGGSNTGGNLFNGYISDLRIVKGTAVYTSDFTPPAESLTAVTNTKLLMNFTNAGIYDAAQINDWSLTGDVVASSTETKYASSSVYFDGNGDRIEIPWNPYLYNQTKPYTVEFWFYPTYNYNRQYVLGRNGGNFFNLKWDGSATKIAVDKQGVGIQITASQTCALNAWHHVAMTYDGTTTTLWINGTNAGTTSGTGGDSNTVMTIGYYAAISTSSFRGYIEDFRWTQGLARYTVDFTPPISSLTG